MKKNHYELNPDITIDKLKEIGFKQGGWMSNIEKPKMSYVRPLVEDIKLCIEINTNTFNFNDDENIVVIDDNFCQAYFPFYNEDATFEYALKVKRAYNDKMDSLVDEGLLTKVKTKTKKKTM